MGVAASGKTSVGRLLAQKTKYKFYDADKFHALKSIQKMKRGIPLEDGDRQPWLKKLRALIQKHLRNNQNMILSCSALKEKYRKALQVDFERVDFIYLKASRNLIAERLKNRQHKFFNSKLMDSQFEILEEPINAYTVNAAISLNTIVHKIVRHYKIIECCNTRPKFIEVSSK